MKADKNTISNSAVEYAQFIQETKELRKQYNANAVVPQVPNIVLAHNKMHQLSQLFDQDNCSTLLVEGAFTKSLGYFFRYFQRMPANSG